MSTVEDIKSAIARLSVEERTELARWMFGGSDDAWDQQMKQDAKRGRLDRLISEAERQIREGQVRDLP